MAKIKNWSKTKENSHGIEYDRNFEVGAMRIMVADEIISQKVNKETSGWSVILSEYSGRGSYAVSFNQRILKTNMTKKEAKTYAIKYMRGH